MKPNENETRLDFLAALNMTAENFINSTGSDLGSNLNKYAMINVQFFEFLGAKCMFVFIFFVGFTAFFKAKRIYPISLPGFITFHPLTGT